ncbi:MAG TPA: cyclic pyranopterin monophosphate synthase MoaC [Anaerolineae bacterium]|nr:cyclic pyranopterin monophosphate synthase MoaC [Anaerolineae bacterium]
MVKKLTHVDEEGRINMVDVGHKAVTAREAVAGGYVWMAPETVALIRAGQMKKGDVLATAELAGIMAAKRTSELIPLCHPLPLTKVKVRCRLEASGVAIEALARVSGQTGVEMEALTAVSVAALTIYDMAKAVDREMRIGEIFLKEKRGGKSGDWVHPAVKEGENE